MSPNADPVASMAGDSFAAMPEGPKESAAAKNEGRAIAPGSEPARSVGRGRDSYVPFGVGTHVCGGSRWAEQQIAADLLLVARHVELELVPKYDVLKLSPLPRISPNEKFKFRVTGHRHPLGPAA